MMTKIGHFSLFRNTFVETFGKETQNGELFYNLRNKLEFFSVFRFSDFDQIWYPHLLSAVISGLSNLKVSHPGLEGITGVMMSFEANFRIMKLFGGNLPGHEFYFGYFPGNEIFGAIVRVIKVF